MKLLVMTMIGKKIKTKGAIFLPDNIYRGYIEFSGNEDEINSFMEGLNNEDLYINEYLILHNTTDNKPTEMRWDGNKWVALNLPKSSYVKGKNSLQRCALDLLYNKDIPIVAILGTYGSGKTYLAMQMGLYHILEKGNQNKILGVREAEGEGKSVGYLKGTFEDKTQLFFKPLEQQLANEKNDLYALQCQGKLDVMIPYYMKGTTYNDTIMIVDEAEDLSESQLRLIGTRMGENTRIFFSGDYKQSLRDKTSNNPLVRMCNEFKGNPLFGCVYLEEDVRSESSKLFANLFA